MVLSTSLRANMIFPSVSFLILMRCFEPVSNLYLQFFASNTYFELRISNNISYKYSSIYDSLRTTNVLAITNSVQAFHFIYCGGFFFFNKKKTVVINSLCYLVLKSILRPIDSTRFLRALSTYISEYLCNFQYIDCVNTTCNAFQMGSIA